MKIKIIFYALCLALISFSCTNDPIQDDTLLIKEADLMEVNANGISNAPNQSGMYIIRFETFFGFVITNFTDLTVICGYNALGLCDDNIDPEFSLIMNQIIFPSGQKPHAQRIAQGELITTVYDGFLTFEEFMDDVAFCNFVTNTPVLATGYSSLNLTDNDVFGSPGIGENTNAFGIRIHGRLLSPENENRNLLARIQFLWDKEDEFSELIEVQHNMSLEFH